MIANLFQEHVLDQEAADRIYEKHMKNPEEFWTPYPFPSMAISDPASVQDRDGNSWGFYSQGLTSLRALRWMDYYGKGEDLEYLMKRWVSALVRSEDIQFSQELHPVTGKLSKSSQWYSSCFLSVPSAGWGCWKAEEWSNLSPVGDNIIFNAHGKSGYNVSTIPCLLF